MMRPGLVLLAFAAIAVASWAYNVNYRTREALDRLSELRAEIADERETLQVLRVEWGFLNRPDRLARLVAAQNDWLGLVALTPRALGHVEAVPYPPRPAPTPPAAPEMLLTKRTPAPAEVAGSEPAGGTAAVPRPPPKAGLAEAPAVAVADPPQPAPAAAPPGQADTDADAAAMRAAIAAALAEIGVAPGPTGSDSGMGARPVSWNRP